MSALRLVVLGATLVLLGLLLGLLIAAPRTPTVHDQRSHTTAVPGS